MSDQNLKIIKTEEQYHSYLEECEFLLDKAPSAGSPESDRLDLLTLLIEKYEEQNFPIEPIDPIEAIKFRMNEQGLKQVDLAPYFGTKSRVSEVLSGKRPLTVQMIRALSSGLGISVETLVGLHVDESQDSRSSDTINWKLFPLSEMISRGWISNIQNKARNKDIVEDSLKKFIGVLSDNNHQPAAAFKRTLQGEAYSPNKKYSIFAWLSKVVQEASLDPVVNDFKQGSLNKEFLKELAHLSWFDEGPKLAIEFIEKHGIKVVIEPALKGMSLDGAALRTPAGNPVIGLTIREDRLDNFWFTLLHETVHIWKHLDTGSTFVDDLERSTEDKIEAEANRIARDTFIPRVAWKRSEAYLRPTRESIEQFAKDLKIHPAIIAGRIRRESGNFKVFADLVGYGEVRKHFSKFSVEEKL
ncbi:ImmA/IrrE family metallo-endopeptidase [Bowmanella pacifica]|uniref:HTH cro/C1-type domain-containing protein n=1 Tax=Bowmanella pacifica TaxID=502051 RepID=A0A918DJC0_9ALTE|nr:ImmA/IrrE family metallo-endopeptidase [Bowmanella pacifica]GGO68218.1 hypothetical protein GCM10010982_16620 [Bowmanella pacifica]